MLKLSEIKRALRDGPYAWPGGYPLYFVCEDGEPLSFEAARENWREIVRAHMQARKTWPDKQWIISACVVNWEDDSLFCAHTNKRIESAYAEPNEAAQ